MAKSLYQPIYDIQAYIEQRLKEATDKEIKACYWLNYGDTGTLAEAVRSEWHRRGLK